jgi:hypothetical protein
MGIVAVVVVAFVVVGVGMAVAIVVTSWRRWWWWWSWSQWLPQGCAVMVVVVAAVVFFFVADLMTETRGSVQAGRHGAKSRSPTPPKQKKQKKN